MALLSILLIVGRRAGRALARRTAPILPCGSSVRGCPCSTTGLGVDRLYVALVARPVLALAHLVVFLDREVVDAYVRGAAAGARLGGVGGRRAHRSERAASGLAWVVAGVVAVALAGVALW